MSEMNLNTQCSLVVHYELGAALNMKRRPRVPTKSPTQQKASMKLACQHSVVTRTLSLAVYFAVCRLPEFQTHLLRARSTRARAAGAMCNAQPSPQPLGGLKPFPHRSIHQPSEASALVSCRCRQDSHSRFLA